MTDIAIRLPQTQSSTVAVTPISWRLRGAAMAAAFVLGTAGSTAAVRLADHGAAVAPAVTGTGALAGGLAGTGSTTTTAFAATSIAPVSAQPLRAFVYERTTGTVREIA
ncbi:hypothetical protein FB565_009019 [Actinoplanes lutulentus]|uniref:Uncharacterized protein n=1 Tax=Actinoplanes lutulentus TaxID=1287878 RepID=A0A327Z8D9_9ACTN|nr:hypothetical protein [Actinoplanes lutulentus]MBB2949214.1 hypothetical protein [Actinoplanes lutulentus]RAK34635.1 hypothetical protein B0I29_111237 [Actinoplanes lutulentus]